jgi:hypothetical protein
MLWRNTEGGRASARNDAAACYWRTDRFASHGTGVCPLGGGEALGCCLPDSKNVGRTAPVASGFAVRELGRRPVLVCSGRVSLFAGLGVSRTAGLGVGAASDSDWPDLLVCDGLGLFSRSAARAPAIRICSSVGSADVDLLPRDLGLVRSGVADSEGVCSGGGAACLGASGFVSRATITSCPCVWPMRIKLQSSTPKNPLGINRRDKQLQPVRKPPFTRRSDLNQFAVSPGLQARENASAIRFPEKSRRDVIRIAETALRQNNGRWSRGLPSPLG